MIDDVFGLSFKNKGKKTKFYKEWFGFPMVMYRDITSITLVSKTVKILFIKKTINKIVIVKNKNGKTDTIEIAVTAKELENAKKVIDHVQKYIIPSNMQNAHVEADKSSNDKSSQPKIASNSGTVQQESESQKQTKMGSVLAHQVPIDTNVLTKLKKRYISFDVETTGLNAYTDRIIEVGAVLFENGEVINSYSSLINIETKIPTVVSSVNHITNDMIANAPKEEVVYPELVKFLGDALNEDTMICAHNASFDINFLSNTLIRLGYDAKIQYVDTLSLSRELIKGLENYKQGTISSYFGLMNEQEHRAVSDATICGKILWELLKLKGTQLEQYQQYLEKIKPSDEELEVCAFIQNCIVNQGGDTQWLGFIKNSSNYIEIKYFYTIVKFKSAQKGKYIIIEKDALKNMNFTTERCIASEGGSNYLRVYFNTPFELEPLSDYFFKLYSHYRKSALDYLSRSKKYEKKAKADPYMSNTLTDDEVKTLLSSAKKRTNSLKKSEPKPIDLPVYISRSDITIKPINKRVPLNEIRNLNDFDKGYKDGHLYWEHGEELRKSGDIKAAIKQFDKARYNGYSAPVLFRSYAMAYRKIKDYDNEIDILDEAIIRENNIHKFASEMEARRDTAVQLLHKQRLQNNKNITRNEKKFSQKIADKKKASATTKKTSKTTKKPVGRAILQLSDAMTVIKRYSTIAEAVRETGINHKSIRDAAKGVQKHAGGFVWRYADENKQ